MQAFSRVNDQMKEKDFVLLVNAYRLKLHEFAIAKFEISQVIDKYLSVSAPGQASPDLKQSYIKFSVPVIPLRRRLTNWPRRRCTPFHSSSASTSRSRRRRSKSSMRVFLV